MTKAGSYKIVCHQCGALNRAPMGKPLSAGKCGKCGATLATPEPVDINDTLFGKLRRQDEGAFVLDIWAPWCGPCRMMAPAYHEAAAHFIDQTRLFKLNADENKQAVDALNIRGIPTLIAYRNGQQITQQSGALPHDALLQWINQSF